MPWRGSSAAKPELKHRKQDLVVAGQVGKAQLLIQGRIILLLDGLDELATSRDRLEEGLRALRELASSGGRIVVTTREGHLASVSPIRTYLSDQWMGQLQPLEPDGGIELLTKYGASDEEAGGIIRHLPRDVVGIPLFLVLAYAARLKEPLRADVLASRALTLLALVWHFCVRDEERIRLPADVQVEMLRDLSDWLSFGGSMSLADAMEVLALVPGEQGAAFIENPHALLSLGPSGVTFRYAQFQHLYLAKAISDKWEGGGFDRGLARDLGKLNLESATLEYLALLLESRHVKEAWQRSWSEPLRSEPFLRRNLIGMALAMLDERGSGETPEARSRILAEVLGNRNLAEVNLAGLSIEQVDLRGWDLTRIRGRGGHIRFCPNMPEAATDNSILTVDDLEGCELIETEVPTELLVGKGKERLEALLRPWINQRVRPASLKPEIAVTTKNLDYEGMRMLTGARLAELVRGPKGARFWKWTAEGRDAIGRFVAKRDQEIPELQPVLVALGR